MDKLDLGGTAVTHAEVSETEAEKKERIRRELVNAGMSRFGLSKLNTQYLPTLIQDGEHIQGILYGFQTDGKAMLSWMDRMIVATDQRVISFIHKPGFMEEDVFTYDVINGVDVTIAGPFSAVSLDTRKGKINLRFVRKQCAITFKKYVADRRMTFFKTRTHSSAKK